MKEKEAIESGFCYTGMSARAYSEDWEKQKARAMLIKKTYKGADFRVVDERCESRSGTSLWKNIYGNAIFLKAQYYKPEETKAYIDSYNERIAKATAEFNAKIAKIKEEQSRQVQLYTYMQSIAK